MIDRARLLTEYQRLRTVNRAIHSRLVGQIPRPVLIASAERLGLLSPDRGPDGNDVLIIDNDHELDVLMDFCLYHGRETPDGTTVVERAAARVPPDGDRDEHRLLRAMQQVRFALLSAVETVPGLGVQVRDVLWDELLLLVDVGLSSTVSPGLVLAGNVISLPEMSMTTGSMLPLNRAIMDELLHHLRERYANLTNAQFGQLSPGGQSELAALVIRTCLAGGASSHVQTRDVDPAPSRRTVNRPGPRAKRRRGRNSR